MTDKELRRLNRLELLEILLEQQKQIAGLEEELTKAKETIDEKDKEISTLTVAGKQAMKDLARKEVELADRSGRLTELEKRLSAQTTESGALNERISDLLERRLDSGREADYAAREQALTELAALLKSREQTLDEQEKRLADKAALLENCGTLADASVAVTDLFTEAQKAVDLYLENVKQLVEKVAAGKVPQTALQTGPKTRQAAEPHPTANSRDPRIPSSSNASAGRLAQSAQQPTVPAARPDPPTGTTAGEKSDARVKQTTTNTVRLFDLIWKKEKK